MSVYRKARYTYSKKNTVISNEHSFENAKEIVHGDRFDNARATSTRKEFCCCIVIFDQQSIILVYIFTSLSVQIKNENVLAVSSVSSSLSNRKQDTGNLGNRGKTMVKKFQARMQQLCGEHKLR